MKFLAIIVCVAVLCGVSQWTTALEDEAIAPRAAPDAAEETPDVAVDNEREELEDADEDVGTSSEDDEELDLASDDEDAEAASEEEVEESEEDKEDNEHPLAKLFGDEGGVCILAFGIIIFTFFPNKATVWLYKLKTFFKVI